MTNDQIANFLSQKNVNKASVRINFKSRNSITGLFIITNDFTELKHKNFWRIVNKKKIAEYQKTKDESLARIYNGSEITKLSLQAQTLTAK